MKNVIVYCPMRNSLHTHVLWNTNCMSTKRTYQQRTKRINNERNPCSFAYSFYSFAQSYHNFSQLMFISSFNHNYNAFWIFIDFLFVTAFCKTRFHQTFWHWQLYCGYLLQSSHLCKNARELSEMKNKRIGRINECRNETFIQDGNML